MKLSIESSTCLDHREFGRLKRLKSESLPLEMLGAIERRVGRPKRGVRQAVEASQC